MSELGVASRSGIAEFDTSAVRIRAATESDGPGIGEAHAASWEQAYTGMFDAAFLARCATGRRVGWQHSIQRICAPPNVLLVAEVEGSVRAFAHAVRADHHDGASEIRGFYAHPIVWGTGIAVELMDELRRELRSRHSYVMLWTPRAARRARRFYEKAGFVPTGEEALQNIGDWTTAETVELSVVQYGQRLADMQ